MSFFTVIKTNASVFTKYAGKIPDDKHKKEFEEKIKEMKQKVAETVTKADSVYSSAIQEIYNKFISAIEVKLQQQNLTMADFYKDVNFQASEAIIKIWKNVQKLYVPPVVIRPRLCNIVSDYEFFRLPGFEDI